MRWPILKRLQGLLARRRPVVPGLEQTDAKDCVHLQLNGLRIDLTREVGLSTPHEISVIVPRAEISRKWDNDKLVEETIVLSSITVVSAPRHVPIEAFKGENSSGNNHRSSAHSSRVGVISS